MSDSDERMLEGDSPEVITKTGNTIEKRIRAADNRAVKKMKTHKKDAGKQNRKRPAEAAGSFTQVAVGMQLITMPCSPFEQREQVPWLLRIPRQMTSATNTEVMDIGPESAERSTNSELAGDLMCKKTNRDFF
jgi:hypothetical protein